MFLAFVLSGMARGELLLPVEVKNLEPAGIMLDVFLTERARTVGKTLHEHLEATEHWRATAAGVEGTETVLRAGDDYRVDGIFGKKRWATGQRGGVRWDLDENGVTYIQTGLHDSEDIVRPSLANATLLGRNADLDAYALAVKRGTHTDYQLYSRTTLELIRNLRERDGRWVRTTYDDFRTLDGTPVPYHVRSGDGRPYNDSERWLESASFNDTVDASQLAIPSSVAPLVVPGGRQRLPAKVVGDRVIITTDIASHQVNFQLDSGASVILLDSGIAEALNLQQFGTTSEAVAGSFVSREALVPSLGIGPLSLVNFFVQSGPADMTFDRAMPVAGLLGSDFLARTVVAIDYYSGTVDALDAKSFTPPAGSSALEARLDDRVPVISVNVGGASSRNFVLDTGADRSMLFNRFLNAHPQEAADQGLGAMQVAAFPFVGHIMGVGGAIPTRLVQVKTLGIGSWSFSNWPMLAIAGEAADFESEDFDGLIGQDVLRYFTLYLDYPHAKVYLTPNERYKQRFG